MATLSGSARRRFWERAAVLEVADGYRLRLDGRPLRLPDETELHCATRALAEAVAEEWNLAGGGKEGVYRLDDLVLTQLAGTMQAHRRLGQAVVIDGLAGFVHSELLCYRAAAPEALVRLQAQRWQPWLDRLGAEKAIAMRVTRGVMPQRQPSDVAQGWIALLGRMSPARLTGMSVAVPILGSLVLGLAVVERALAPSEAWDLARLDEVFQAAMWGADAQGERRSAQLGTELALAARFMELADG